MCYPLCSTSAPTFRVLVRAETCTEFARRTNESTLEIVHEHPTRSQGLGILPLQDSDTAIRLLEEHMRTDCAAS